MKQVLEDAFHNGLAIGVQQPKTLLSADCPATVVDTPNVIHTLKLLAGVRNVKFQPPRINYQITHKC